MSWIVYFVAPHISEGRTKVTLSYFDAFYTLDPAREPISLQ